MTVEPDEGGGESEVGPWWRSLAEEHPSIDLKTDQPHTARIYDYFLGGKDNFPADRVAAEQASAAFPNASLAARQNRAFMVRAIRHLAGEAGIRQFLDVGTGIPTSPNVHEIAQAVTPQARVVYTDNDPIVLAHARALLASTPQGRTAYLDADLHDPQSILAAPELRETLDLSQPVALSMIAVFHFVPDSDDPHGIIRSLVDALPSGSYLILTNGTADHDPATQDLAVAYEKQGITVRLRSRTEVEGLFGGLELIDPGVELVHRWRPAAPDPPGLTDAQVSVYGGIARKP
ncbi:S-adenosyl methyltransferase [Frankia torreyi]|uniref:S-adenosyl methyltransferase n=2 Tax=Frankia TaxID=1854 RepID=A0A0D8B980_9ACTN|nr:MULTISPECIES: SAM-dependent methyltransferase [Frankia]KJE19937.1 S-adenosyl methyltransferase [Frankia torreyi]KQM07511.1 S-adenosyl methyltransferase [Frankia sp. CpI1-P]